MCVAMIVKEIIFSNSHTLEIALLTKVLRNISHRNLKDKKHSYNNSYSLLTCLSYS